MSKKNLIIIALILGVIALVSQYLLNQSDTQDSVIGRTLISTDLASSIDEVEITGSDSSLHLKLVEGQWNIIEKDNYPVSMEKLFKLINELATSKVASLVTKDPKRFAHFKVMDKGDWQGRGRVLTLKQAGQEKFKLLIGKQRDKLTSKKITGVPDGTYIRFGAENAVYLVKENLKYKAEPDEWIRTRLYKVDKEKIKSVTLKNPVSFTLLREEKGKDFQLVKQTKSKVDQKKVTALLEKMNELSAVKIEKNSPTFSAGLTKSTLVAFSLFDGTDVKLQLYTKKGEGDKKEYWLNFPAMEKRQDGQWDDLVTLSNNWFFNIYSYQAEPFLQKQKEFLQTDSK
jgi:hypothetical protein